MSAIGILVLVTKSRKLVGRFPTSNLAVGDVAFEFANA